MVANCFVTECLSCPCRTMQKECLWIIQNRINNSIKCSTLLLVHFVNVLFCFLSLFCMVICKWFSNQMISFHDSPITCRLRHEENYPNIFQPLLDFCQ